MAGESFVATDLYAPVLKAHESRLLLAIAAAEGCSVYKTDTSHAFLYGSMENDAVYIRAPDWWPEPIPEGHCLQLVPDRPHADGTITSRHGWRRTATLRKIVRKTIFMKGEGKHFIIHGLFVDDMMHIST